MSLNGIGVSPGVVVGSVHRIVHVDVTSPVPGTITTVLDALSAVASDLEHRAENIDLDIAKDVLSAQAMIARDPSLEEALTQLLMVDTQYADVRPAIDEAFSGFRNALLSLGGYFAERVEDLDEIAHRTVLKLSGLESDDVALTKPSVVIAQDLTPADTAALDLNYALALVVEKGGPTSHTAIVARGLGIPAIVGCAGALELDADTTVLVDGREGIVIASPTESEIAQRQETEAKLRVRAESVTGPGRLSDGTAIALMGNAGNENDAISAAKAEAEGIGLFRTELLFLDRQTEPSVDDQVQMYRAVFDAMGERKVIVRTLDAGSDKPVPFLNAVDEENPALGVRGWRLTRIANDVLERQLDAIGRAANETAADVWVMAPMIDTPAEAAEFAARARAHGIAKVGVMIETPAAALLADKVLAEVDFASLGTNDLTQYVMAADRLDSRLSDLTSSWHPAVLRAISQAAHAAGDAGKPIGVCGESAANPQLAAVLLGLGVTSLSMAPSAIAEVRGYLAGLDLNACHRAAHAAINARSAEEAREQVLQILGA
jgi:phosphotransferase system enzyme I (PtsI)